MSALIPVDINGVTFQAHGEYTSSAVAQEFQNSLAAFVNLFNLGLPGTVSRGITPDDPDNPNPPDLLAQQIDAALNDPNYAVSLQAALVGGTVTKNYYVQPGEQPPAENVSVVGLFNLVRDGLEVTDDPVLRPGTQFLSLEMAGALEQLIRSLQLAGVPINQTPTGFTLAGPITPLMIKNWKNLSASSDAIRTIMQYAVDTSGNQNRTLQALVELIYVRTGNELLSNNLERLEEALSATKGSLDALNRLQVLHNKITAEEKQKFDEVFWGYGGTIQFIPRNTFPGTPMERTTGTFVTIDPASSPEGFVQGTGGQPGVVDFANEHFAGIDPTLLDQISESDRIEFKSLRQALIEEIRDLEVITPEDEVQGSLLERMRIVLGDIHAAFSAAGVPGLTASTALPSNVATADINEALTFWILDSTQVTNTLLNIPGVDSGGIQRNLSAALSAGQSLNDTQKEEVRRYLFVFEEYYKSAAAILSKITQILERMAQAISR